MKGGDYYGKGKSDYYYGKGVGKGIDYYGKGKSEIEFVVEEVAEGYQANVTLNCFEEAPGFVGEPGETAKEAEQNAAKQVLEYYAGDFARLPPSNRSSGGRN